MARGTFRIYLGAAPGVGKTYAMLGEGNRRAARGADVVIGHLQTRGRHLTEAQVGALPTVPLDAVIARHPAVVLVDDLAGPGRWRQVEAILDAGIDVISTMNVQHIASLADVVERITGVSTTDTVPDAFVRSADQVELVDLSPEALRRRLAHGNVYPAEDVDSALADFFRPGNLAALRELALLWVADRVDRELKHYLDDHAIDATWETRERVVVAVTGAPTGDHVIRRAARLAGRLRGELIGLHVASPDRSATRSGDSLERQRALLVELGATYREVVSHRVADAIAAFAVAEHATQVVVGTTRRSRVAETIGGSLVSRVQRLLPGVDVHIISDRGPTQSAATPPRATPGVTAIPRSREMIGWLLTLVAQPMLTSLLVTLQHHLNLSSALLVNLALVTLIAAIGGLRPGVVAAVSASLLANWYLTPPLHTLSIAKTDNVIALGVFLTVTIGVSLLVDRAARQSREVHRVRADATALARSTGSIIAADDPLPDLVDQIYTLFGATSVAVLIHEGAAWTIVAAAGLEPPAEPSDGHAIALDDDGQTFLVLKGSITEADLSVLRAFGDQVALAIEARQLRRDARTIEHLEAANVLRTSLLRAVSHDLRTPLASIKASVTGLMSGDVGFTDDDRRELLDTIDASVDRLDRVVGNLLDMSRIQAGAARPMVAPAPLEEVVAAALASLRTPTTTVVVDVSEELPLVLTDAALLERALANIVSNALAWSPDGVAVRIDAAVLNGMVRLRVIDRGPGIPVAERTNVFEPFHRLGDRSHDAGAGLGLAIAKGFVEVTGAFLELDDTPGGGSIFTITLPVAHPSKETST